MNSEQAIEKAKTLYPKWVAQDKNGAWFGYESEPQISEHHNYWCNPIDPEWSYLLSDSDGKQHPDWKKSLREVK